MAKLHDELRKLWANAGYHTKMGSAAVVQPPPANYRRLYHLTTAEYAVSNIVFLRLKVALLHQLNDPFELLAARFLGNRSVGQAVQANKEDLAKKQGLLCFSADWTDPVLWTHYGAKHTGICLGFDVPVSIAKKVNYRTERIDSAGLKTIDKNFQEKLLCTKYESWRYEQEWRVQIALDQAIKEADLYFSPIGPEIQLAEIILGSLCNLPVAAVRKLADTHHRDVVTFQARLAKGSFDIVPNEPTIPPGSHGLYRQ